jgi:hypothetical protein
MMHDDTHPEEDKLLDLAAACDDALADGRVPDSASASPGLGNGQLSHHEGGACI